MKLIPIMLLLTGCTFNFQIENTSTAQSDKGSITESVTEGQETTTTADVSASAEGV